MNENKTSKTLEGIAVGAAIASGTAAVTGAAIASATMLASAGVFAAGAIAANVIAGYTSRQHCATKKPRQ